MQFGRGRRSEHLSVRVSALLRPSVLKKNLPCKHAQEQTNVAKQDLFVLVARDGTLLHYPLPLPGFRWSLGEVNTPPNRLSSRGKAALIFSGLLAAMPGSSYW